MKIVVHHGGGPFSLRGDADPECAPFRARALRNDARPVTKTVVPEMREVTPVTTGQLGKLHVERSIHRPAAGFLVRPARKLRVEVLRAGLRQDKLPLVHLRLCACAAVVFPSVRRLHDDRAVVVGERFLEHHLCPRRHKADSCRQKYESFCHGSILVKLFSERRIPDHVGVRPLECARPIGD